MRAASPTAPATRRRGWIVIAVAALMVLVSTGMSRSFGLFLSPITDSLGTGREVFSLAIAVQSLIFGLPLAGMLADRIGARWVIFWSGLLLATGLVVTSQIESVPGLFIGVAVLAGVALSGTGFVVALGAVGRAVPQSRRTAAFGLITAAGSAGILVMAALSQTFIGAFGWQTALVLLAVIMVIVTATALLLPSDQKADLDPAAALPMAQALDRARTSRSYLLLVSGFFVCGFHVSFIGNHLPAFLEDGGLDSWVAPAALGLIGLFNIGGSLFFGSLGDRMRKRTLLAFLYSTRAALMVVFLLVPLTTASPVDALRHRVSGASGGRLPRRVARRAHLRRHRLLRHRVDDRHRSRHRFGAHPPSDQGEPAGHGAGCGPLLASSGSLGTVSRRRAR